MPRGLEFFNYIQINLAALALTIGPCSSANIDALVPVQTEPAQGINQLLIAFLGVSSGIGVLNAKDEFATGSSRICPVEESGSDKPNVRGSGRAWAEANSDVFARSFGHGCI